MPCWILKLLPFIVSAKIEINHLRNALRRRRQAQLSPHFRSQGAKMSTWLQKSKWSPWITVSKTFRIGWAIVEKSRPELDPKWTPLCDLLPTGSSWWRNFRWNVKTIEGYGALNFEIASFSSFQGPPKIISWRRMRRRTSTITLSENAFAFRYLEPTVFECIYDRPTFLKRQQSEWKQIGNKVLELSQRCSPIGGSGKTSRHQKFDPEPSEAVFSAVFRQKCR